MRSLKLNDVAFALGIRVYCNNCGAWYDPRVESTKIRANDCKHPSSSQVYKSTICVPKTGEKKSRKSICYETRNLSEVVIQGLEFKNHIKNLVQPEVQAKVEKPTLLIDCLAMFLDFKQDIGVKQYQIRNLSKGSLNAFENHINRWKEATELAGEAFDKIRVDKISEDNVECTIKHLSNWGTSIQKKAFGFYNQFYRYLNDKGYKIESPFKGIIVSDCVMNDARAVTKHEFNIIKTAMQNGSPTDKLKGKIQYFNWLPEAMDFAVFSGRRREEFIIAKFSDIHLIDGELLGGYIKMIDSKFTKQNTHAIGFQPRYTKAPIFPELYEFLIKMGYEKYKDTDRYIVAGDEIKQRDTLANNLTNAFGYYRSKVEISPLVQLKGLRKTYITRMRNEFGDNANFFTGHKDSRIDKKHYYDDKELFEKVKNFVLWKK